MAALGLACSAPAEDTGAANSPPARSKEASSPKKGKAAKAVAAKTDPENASATKVVLEKATFGGGCFWCLEAVFEQVKGVKAVVSGYAGGNVPKPFYELVGTGETGHAEVVQVQFDPKIVSYEELLKVFWSAHDPTTPNRQGPDVGTQYRSIILYHDDMQRKTAQEMYEALTSAHVFAAPIVTQLAPLTRFYPAERYHQDYFRKHPDDPYCQMMIIPKLQMIRLKQQAH
jgi:peptide-methionine (S)-S-oxide reductase